MDLATGAKATWVMMDLLTKARKSKLVGRCTYPLTGVGCVKRVYTDLATFEITPDGLQVVEMVQGLSHHALEELVELSLIASRRA